MTPNKNKDLDFGVLEFYDDYVVGRIKSNVEIDSHKSRQIISAIDDYYGNRKKVYISDRSAGYEVDQSFYKKIDHKKLIGIAIVSNDREKAIQIAQKEQDVYKGSFAVFNSMESAVSWAKSFVKECD